MIKKIDCKGLLKCFHDFGLGLTGIAALVALYQTSGVLDQILVLQKQASIIEETVKDLKALQLLEGSKIEGKVNPDKLKTNIIEFNNSNSKFKIQHPNELMLKLEKSDYNSIKSSSIIANDIVNEDDIGK